MLASRNGEKQKEIQIGPPASAVAAVLLALLLAVPAFTSATRNVSLYVTVEDGGNLIQGLTAQNFRLFQDDKAQRFDLDKPETPASIALLLENSQGSFMFYDDTRAAVQGFIDKATDGNLYALATFAQHLDVQVDFTKQIGRIREAFAELPLPTWNDTDTYDAIYEMLDKMSLLPGRRVLIVIASGFDSFSRRTTEDVRKKIESSDVTVFSVGLGSLLRGIYDPYLSDMDRLDLNVARNFLTMLSDESGGDSWFPNQEGAYREIMKGVMQTLESQYRLVYSPKAVRDGKLHKIEVQAFQVVNDQRRDFKVRVRRGWRF